jgi:hypothetical protein
MNGKNLNTLLVSYRPQIKWNEQSWLTKENEWLNNDGDDGFEELAHLSF